MKIVIRQANLSGSTHWFTWTIAALLLPLSWAVPASGKTQANPPEPSEVAAENQVAAAPTAQPEVWLCAGKRMADLFGQSWYPYPKQIVPETAPHTMTALVKAVIEQVRLGTRAGETTRHPR